MSVIFYPKRVREEGLADFFSEKNTFQFRCFFFFWFLDFFDVKNEQNHEKCKNMQKNTNVKIKKKKRIWNISKI